MRLCVLAAAFAATATAAVVPAAFAQQPPPAVQVGASQLARANLAASTASVLIVTSPAFTPSDDIPLDNTSWGKNIFPGLRWSTGPSGTRSYVVIVQDGDAMSRGAPILHWTMFNIPASVNSLDAGMSAPPAGAEYGPNIRGPAHAYMGPHTPPGPDHRYHFQVFALDTSIPSGEATTYAGLTAAMKGHVLASGEIVGLGHAPAPAPAVPN